MGAMEMLKIMTRRGRQKKKAQYEVEKRKN